MSVTSAQYISQVAYGQTGEQNNPQNAAAADRIGQLGETVVSQLFGKHQELVNSGRVFHYRGATAGNTLAAPGTSGQFMIWNPTGTTVKFVPLRVSLGFVSGTTLAGSICVSFETGLGSQTGTAAPVVSFTGVTPYGAQFGGSFQNVSVMNFSPTTNTLTAAPTILQPIFTVGASATFVSGATLIYDFDGSMEFWPGTGFFITGSVASQAGVYIVEVIGAEVPVGTGA